MSTEVEGNTLIRTQEERDAKDAGASNWYVKVKIHNQAQWTAHFYSRILRGAGQIEVEPDSYVSAYTMSGGGKYDAPWGPYGVAGLVVYNSPDPKWRFAWSFSLPYIGENSTHPKIIDKDRIINYVLFDEIHGSSAAVDSKEIIIDGERYKATISSTIGSGTTPNAGCFINIVAE